MRISSGILKGMNLVTQDSLSTRPTGIKVRQAVFNSIQQLIENTKFLDLFAGSGAIGIEALSRGASEITLVESSQQAFKFLSQNIKKASEREPLSKFYPLREDVTHYLKRACSNSHDIIWADPPYADCLKFSSIFNIHIPRILKDTSSLFILESSSKESTLLEEQLTNLELVKIKTYGVSSISFFKIRSDSKEKIDE